MTKAIYYIPNIKKKKKNWYIGNKRHGKHPIHTNKGKNSNRHIRSCWKIKISEKIMRDKYSLNNSISRCYATVR